MSLEILQILVYCLLGIAVTFYVVLDGFDLGVGSLQIFAGEDRNRRIFLNSIGPFWDGNEVWLIVIVGVAFVGFPDVYASLLSGFYELLMIFICGIVFRAVAIEFRSKLPSLRWRYTWDFIFWFASLVITFGAGIALANLIKGVPIDADRELYYPFHKLFVPYSVFFGFFSIFLFAMHGNIFLLFKTDGYVQDRLRAWAPYTLSLFIVTFIVLTFWTWIECPHMLDHFVTYPLFFIVPVILICAIIAMCFFIAKHSYGWSFLMSMITIILLFSLFAIGTFPNIVISTLGSGALSLTLFNASSSYLTLSITLIIACIGIPLVLGYGWLLYHIFRGKTELHDQSY